MASVKDVMNSDLMKFSISCFDVPEGLLDKNVAKNYFQQFGKLLRIRLRPKQKVCIVEYSNEESGVRALTESGDFDGLPFRVAWTKQKSVEKKKSRKKIMNPDWPMDSDIQSELEAMRGSYSSSRVFAPRLEDQPLDSSKKTTLVKKSPKPSKTRQWKVEKPKTKPDIVTSLAQNSEQEQELLKLVMNFASTSEEKFRILDARDKLIRSRTVRQSELSRVAKTIGTCPDMCPEKERLMREVQHQVASYEQLSAHKGSMNHNLAVKQYSRSSADQESPLPHELRPVKVLLLTMGYLLHKIMDLCESDANLGEWYHFVWDRTRGIRKDVTQQELCCLDSVKLVEQCARFHVFCAARLVSEDVSIFDDKINTENLTKCLQTLKYMYHDLRVKHGVVCCPNEAEFRAYIVLLNLNDGNFMWEVQQLDKIIQQSPEIRFALQVYSALDKNNYVRFFKLVKSTTYLNACILLRYFNQVRFKALLTILKSYSPRQPYMQYPIVELCRTLAFEDFQNTVAFIEYYGLGLNPEKTHVVLDRRMFQQPDMPFVLERAINVIESKRGCSVGEVVCGAPLPSKDFERHVPQNSFDDNGFLKLTELPKEFQEKYNEFLGKYSVIHTEINEIINEEMKIDEIEDEKVSDVEKTDPKINENSASEPDGTLTVFPAFKSQNFGENRSRSPLTVNLTNNNDSFWSKPPLIQFNSPSNLKNIFGNVPKPKEPEFKPISTGQSFSFVATTSITTPVIPIVTKVQPVVTTSTNCEPVWSQTVVTKKIENIEPNEEQLKKDIEEMKELMRKLKEKEEQEAKIKMDKKLQKEREILKKMQKEQEAVKLDAKIKTEASIVLHDVLNQVEEHLVRTRLSEISENIKKRRALQFVKRWRNLTRISRKKRKNFFDNPVWISSKSVSSEAKDLYSPSESLTLQDIKRYKRGVPETIKIFEQKSLEAIDIFSLVYRILFEKLCTTDSLLNLSLFWKIGMSFRTGQENNTRENRFYSTLKNVFDWQEINNESLIVKRCNANNGGSLTYCIKELTDFDKSTYLNGVIFVNLGSINQSTYNRLIKIINKSIPVPIVIIIKDNTNIDKTTIVQQLKLNYLIEKELIIDYEVLFCSDKNLELTLSSSLKFLANNVTAKSNLEMDALPVFLRNCIGEEFWYRIRSSCRINERLNILLREPNISIELHNESLRKSLDIILDSDFVNQPSFPNEFKPFVKQQQILLPCTYEYFPDYWNSKYYLNKVKKATETLFLPKFDYFWPPKDQCDLQDILEEYCGKIFKDPTCIVLKLLSLLLDKIDLNTNFQNQMSLVSWTDVIQVIILEKLSNTKFYDKTHAVYTVVYKSNDLKEFRELPWWYTTEMIKNKIKLVQIEEYSEPEIITDESEDEIDLDKTYSELKQDEDDNFDEQKKLKDDFRNLTSLLADLEESMEIQQKIMIKFQEKVTGTFHCK